MDTAYDPGYEVLSAFHRMEPLPTGRELIFEDICTRGTRDSLFVLITKQISNAGMWLSLYNGDQRDSYQVRQINNRLVMDGGNSWRLLITGCLSDVVESTLVTDVSEPTKVEDTGWIKPGSVVDTLGKQSWFQGLSGSKSISIGCPYEVAL